MVGNGHEVLAAAPGISPQIETELKKIGVAARSLPLDRTGMNPLQDLKLLWFLRNLFRKESPSLLLSYTIKPIIYGSLAARLARIPHVFSIVTGLGYVFLGETFKQRASGVLAKVLYRAALRRNQRVFFQNPDDLAEFRRLRLLARADQAIRINGSGVNLDYYAPAPPVVAPVSFLMIGRLYREKGIHEYIEAARILKQRFPQARFQVVGAIDSNPSAIRPQELAAWQREKLIEHTGWVDDVRPHLRAASVYVLPSYREGTPRSVLEAMAMARPIITTDAPGCRETVVHGQNGFLVPIKNAQALAEAMELFVRAPSMIPKMGDQSRRLAETKFDVHSVNRVMLAVMGLSGKPSK